MEARPHPLAERVVERLLPPPCREHVMGDLYERNATTWRYLWDVARSVPFAVWGQVRRTTPPALACLQGGAVYGGFLSPYGGMAPRALQTPEGLLGTAVPALAAVLVLALRDAWTGGSRRAGIRSLVDVPLSVAIACAAHVTTQAFRAPGSFDSTVTLVAGVTSVLLLTIVRASHVRTNAPLAPNHSGGSNMAVPHSDGAPGRWTRLWLLALVPLGAAVGLGASYSAPPVYRASASLLLMAPELPVYAMPVDLRPRLRERLEVTARQVLDRTQLERLILEFNLYPRERRSTQDAVVRMRRDISLQIVARGENGAVFTVTYRAAAPRTALRVAERLASIFIMENLKDAEAAFDHTDQALQWRLAEMGQRLAAVSRELDMARRGSAGARPVAVLNVEHEVIRDQYRSLFESAQTSRTGRIVERHAIGEQFRVLEPARLPERPVEPVRLWWSGLGAAAGLIVACAVLLTQWGPRPPRAPSEATAQHA